MPPAVAGVAGDQILDRPLDVRPILLEEGIVRVVQRLAIGLEHATCVAVGERLLAGRMRRRGNAGAVVHAAVGPLLVLEVDPPHLLFQVGEEPGEALLVAPDVGAGRVAAAVGAFPAVDVAVGDAEHHADVADRGRLRRQAVEQPVGERAVVEGLAERLGPLADRGQMGGGLVDHGLGVGPERRVMAAHPRAGRRRVLGAGLYLFG